MNPATPLASLIPDAASLINEAVDVLRAIIRDTTATPETRRRAAASLLHFLLPRPSTARIRKPSDRATDSDAAPAEKSVRTQMVTDSLPLPLGEVEGRDPPRRSAGEEHQPRASSPPRATDSDAAPAEKSVPNSLSRRERVARRGGPGEGCLDPSPHPGGGGEDGPTKSGQVRGAPQQTPVIYSEPTASAVALRRDSANDSRGRTLSATAAGTDPVLPAPPHPKPETPNPRPDASPPEPETPNPEPVVPDPAPAPDLAARRAAVERARQAFLAAAAGSKRSLDTS